MKRKPIKTGSTRDYPFPRPMYLHQCNNSNCRRRIWAHRDCSNSKCTTEKCKDGILELVHKYSQQEAHEMGASVVEV
jgi:hypothetical protein